jgi:hypothetical protein
VLDITRRKPNRLSKFENGEIEQLEIKEVDIITIGKELFDDELREIGLKARIDENLWLKSKGYNIFRFYF